MVISLDDVLKARKIISKDVRKTELSFSRGCSKRLGTDVYLKFENEQLTGSFKTRGAVNKLHSLSEEERARGVVACSAGNHAQGVAFAATLLNVKSHVVMPEVASAVKIAGTQGYGAEVILHGEIFDQAYDHARALEKEHGYTFIHPFEDPLIIAGQGTIGLEIFEDLSRVDMVVIPLGGGGLISGIATALKSQKPDCKIIGVQSEKAHGMCDLFHHKNSVEPKLGNTIADGIAMKVPSRKMYDDYISRLVDEIVTVNDDQIAEAIVFLLERAKSVVEGAGAIGLAAALSGKIPSLGKCCCFILSGGNIDMSIVSKVIEKGMAHRGRLVKLSVVIDDLPGNLNRLTQVLAEKRVNIIQIEHDRISQGLFLRETRVDFLLETVGPDHIKAIREGMVAIGARIL